MARDAAFASGITRFFTGPLVCGALLVRRFSTFTRNLALLGPIH
jgi:hypothetical protein